MKKLSRLLAVVLALVLVAVTFAACKPATPDEPGKDDPTAAPYVGPDTLVVGYSRFSGKFSPFFATTAYDQDVAGMTAVGLISTDREGNVVYKGIEGEKRTFN